MLDAANAGEFLDTLEHQPARLAAFKAARARRMWEPLPSDQKMCDKLRHFIEWLVHVIRSGSGPGAEIACSRKEVDKFKKSGATRHRKEKEDAKAMLEGTSKSAGGALGDDDGVELVRNKKNAPEELDADSKYRAGTAVYAELHSMMSDENGEEHARRGDMDWLSSARGGAAMAVPIPE